jgi:hypothetical protein
MISNCPVCSCAYFINIFKEKGIPAYNLRYYNDLHSALNAEKVEVEFVMYKECSFLFNRAYVQLDYNVEYNANRSYSGYFNKYLNRISIKIIKNLLGKVNTVLEIGAGDCSFAEKIISNSNIRKYYAFDPSISDLQNNSLITKVKGYYSVNDNINPDLVILRHVLEHISNVKDFIKFVLFENPQYAYIEIPCSEFIKN